MLSIQKWNLLHELIQEEYKDFVLNVNFYYEVSLGNIQQFVFHIILNIKHSLLEQLL